MDLRSGEVALKEMWTTQAGHKDKQDKLGCVYQKRNRVEAEAFLGDVLARKISRVGVALVELTKLIDILRKDYRDQGRDSEKMKV